MSKFVIGSAVLLMVLGGTCYIAWSNYAECRAQFSVLYCVSTHLVKL